MALQHLRSSTANKRPTPGGMSDGQLALNTNVASPGLFFKDSTGALVKVGPVHVGTTAPNATPASGGQSGNSVGEQWLDTTGGTYVFKVWDGSAWRSESGTFVDVNGDVMTGALGIIAGSAGSPGLYISGDTNTGIYSPGADQLALSTNGTGRLFINSSGYTSIGNSSPQALVHFGAGTSAPAFGTASNLVYVCTAGQTEVQLRTTVNDVTGSIYTDSNGVNIRAASAHPLSFLTSNTERLRITSAGLVGVGTSTPTSAKLDVRDDVNYPIRWGSTSAQFGELSYETGNCVIGATSGNKLTLRSAGTAAITIDTSQRVGIGTSSPGAPLNVRFDNAGLTTIALFENQRSVGGSPDAAQIVVGARGYNHTIIRQNSDQGTNAIGGTLDTVIANTYGSPGAKLILATQSTAQLTVDASGNVGIGTSSPQHKLVVSNGGVQNIEFNWDGASTNFIQSYNRSTSQYLPLSFYSSQHIFFNGTNNSESGRFDSSGRLLVGTSSSRNWSGIDSQIQIESTSLTSQSIINNSASVTPGLLALGKSRGTSVGSNTIVQNGDTLGNIVFLGADGSALKEAAYIRTEVDGTPGANDMPGRLVFSTTADGAASPTERLRIDSSGRVGIGTSTPPQQLSVHSASTTDGRIEAHGIIARDNWGSASGLGNGMFSPASNTLAFTTNSTERFRCDSSGRLLVGTSTVTTTASTATNNLLALESTNNYSGVSFTANCNDSNGSYLVLKKSRGTSTGSTTVVQSGDEIGNIFFEATDGSVSRSAASIRAFVDGGPGSADMPGRLVFSTTADGASSPTERFRVTSGGEILIGKTSLAFTATGVALYGSGEADFVRDSDPPIYVRRNTSDGTLIGFYQDDTQEGSISVSGTTVSYNGAHLSRWSQLAGIDPYDKTIRPEILRGTVMSNLDEMCDWTCPASGDCQDNEQLNKTKISDVEGDKNVAGVFQSWDDDDDTWVNDFYLAMTGDFVIRIAAGTTVQRGDLLMSAGDGTAKPQNDDIIRSKTIAKVTSTNVSCTHPDGSYCVPCVLMAC